MLVICFFGLTATNDSYADSQCNGVETSLIDCESGESRISSLLSLVLNIAIIGIGILAVIGISAMGVQYIMAKDDPAKANKAKIRIFEILIGLACFVMIWGVTSWLLPGGGLGDIKDSSDLPETPTIIDVISPYPDSSSDKSDTPDTSTPNSQETPKSGSSSTSDSTSGSGSGAGSTEEKTTKIIIALGASQVARIAGKSYLNLAKFTSRTTRQKYSTADGTLNFIYKSGTGFSYQAGDGWAKATELFKKYSSKKSSTYFYVFFTLVGNDIARLKCTDINGYNQTLAGQISTFNQLIAGKKGEGYHVIGYVTSVQPLDVANATKNSKVVTNNNANFCKSGYRSNYKYKLYNTVMSYFVSGQSDLVFLDTFSSIMNSNYSFTSGWKSYKTTDGIHWNKTTASNYFKLWMGKSGQV